MTRLDQTISGMAINVESTQYPVDDPSYFCTAERSLKSDIVGWIPSIVSSCSEPLDWDASWAIWYTVRHGIWPQETTPCVSSPHYQENNCKLAARLLYMKREKHRFRFINLMWNFAQCLLKRELFKYFRLVLNNGSLSNFHIGVLPCYDTEKLVTTKSLKSKIFSISGKSNLNELTELHEQQNVSQL